MNLFLFPDNYRKNLFCMQEVTDKVLSHMKGHNHSFRQEITDRNGKFSQKKLDSLSHKLVSLWAARLREVTDVDPATGESVAESYIKARLELYRCYLYLVMRCSLCKDAYVHIYGYIKRAFWSDRGTMEYEYAHSRGDDVKEQPDFAFLLKQAKYLSRSWCVMADSHGHKWNELYEGYDRHFGFHLYHVLNTPWDMLDRRLPVDGSTLTPEWKLPCVHLNLLTNEGNQKRFFIRHPSFQKYVPASRTEEAEEMPQSDEDIYDSTDGYGGCETDGDGYDNMDGRTDESDPDGMNGWTDEDDSDGMSGAFDHSDGWESPELYDDAEFEKGRLEQLKEEADRAEWRKYHARSLECREEYLAACRSFKALFEKAEPEVLRGFYEDLEEIVNLYLAEQEVSSLTDTDKTLDVYSRVYDEACRQAELYERGS